MSFRKWSNATYVIFGITLSVFSIKKTRFRMPNRLDWPPDSFVPLAYAMYEWWIILQEFIGRKQFMFILGFTECSNVVRSTHQTWSNQLDYVLSTVGYCVGTGSILGWPYQCMRNGGGAFVIAVLIFTVIGTIPCVYLEMTIGQFSQSGTVSVWNLCPPVKGIGVGALVISLCFASYASIFLSWFLYYFYHSFAANIPWTSCDNEWNTPTCISHRNLTNETMTNSTSIAMFVTTSANVSAGLTAAEEFWRYHVLAITSGLGTTGSLRNSTVGCLVITYFGIFLCILKGIKVSGKIVYVTATVPYIIITVLLVRGCLLPGAANGIYYYIYPKFERLLEPQIWVDALRFAPGTLAVGWGVLISLAGHNKLSNNCLRDAILVSLVDQFSSIYCGFTFFTIMGHVAYLRGTTVDAFETSGFNLAFIVYPEAVASLPLPQLWSAMTFFMMFTLGIDSLAPCFEITVTSIMEHFPKLAHRRWLVILIILLPMFLISLVYTSQGGMYVLTLVDWYAYYPSLLVFAFLECIVVSWIYGIGRMNNDIAMMWGKPTPRMISICLQYICPVLVLVLFCYSLYSYRPPKYEDYIYPTWATWIGWTISFASIIPTPIIFVWTVVTTRGDTLKERLKNALKPNKLWGTINRPN